MNKSKRIISFVLITVLLVSIDQITKALAVYFLTDNKITIIPDFLSLELLWNRGAAFGILQDSRVFFCILTIVVCLIIEFYYFRIPNEKEFRFLKITFVILLSGAIGNLVDRIKRGSVIDYIAFTFGTYHFPSFNVADMFVSVSAILMLILIVFYYKDEQLIRIFSLKGNKKKSAKPENEQ